MASKAQVRIPITAEDKTKKAFRSAESNLTKMKVAAKGLTAAFGPLAIAAAAVGAALGAARLGGAALDAADKVHKLSKQLDVSTEALSQYKHVAELTGTSFPAITKGFSKMQKNLADAADGLSTASRAFEDLNLDVDKLRALAPEQAFEAIGEAIYRIEDPARKTQVALNIFGKSGGELIQTFSEGAGAVRKMREEADRLGMTISQDQANKAAAYQDAMTRLKGAFSAVWMEIATNLAPYLTAVGEFLSNNLPFATAFAIKAFNDLRYYVVAASQKVVESIGWLAEQLGKLPDAMGGEKFRGWGETMGGWAEDLDALKAKYDVTRGSIEKFAVATANIANQPVPDVAGRATPTVAAGPVIEKDVRPAVEAVEDLLMDVGLGLDDVGQAAQGMGSELGSAARRGADQMASALSAAVFEGKNLLESLGSVAKSVFGSVFGGFLKMGIGSLIGGPIGAAIAGTRAMGGPVAGGSSYVVGERGPEVFTPQQSGTITPNHKVAASGGITIGNLTVSVAGTISDDPLSVRRFARLMKDELEELAKHEGPSGVAHA